MTKRKLPETSLEAWRQKDTRTDKAKIISVLYEYKNYPCNYEDIAILAGMQPVAVGRRLSELEREGKIEKSGHRRRTGNGMYANCYKLKS